MEQTTTRPKTQPLENKIKQNKEAKPHTKKLLLLFIYRKNGNTSRNIQKARSMTRTKTNKKEALWIFGRVRLCRPVRNSRRNFAILQNKSPILCGTDTSRRGGGRIYNKKKTRKYLRFTFLELSKWKIIYYVRTYLAGITHKIRRTC